MIINNLELRELFELKSKEYPDKKKAMTAVMIQHLEDWYPEEKEELKLVVQKAQKYLKK